MLYHGLLICLKGYSYLATVYNQIAQRKQKLGPLFSILISIKLFYVISDIIKHLKYRSQSWCLIQLFYVETGFSA